MKALIALRDRIRDSALGVLTGSTDIVRLHQAQGEIRALSNLFDNVMTIGEVKDEEED